METNSPFSLKSKVLDAHQSTELPGFSLPKDSCLLTVQRNAITHKFEMQIDWLTSNVPNGTTRSALLKDFLPLLSALKPNGAFKIKTKNLPSTVRIPTIAVTQELQILPVSLLSSAKACLLFPMPSDKTDTFFGQYFAFLSEVVEKSLFEFLELRYTPEYLFHFKKVEALVEDYNDAIAEWLCPHYYTCSLKKGKTSYLENFWGPSNRFTLSISNGNRQKVETVFDIPSHGYPVAGKPDHVHELNFVSLKKHLLASQLNSFFEHLHRHWIYDQRNFDLSGRQVDKVINVIKTIHQENSAHNQALSNKVDELERVFEQTPSNAQFAFFLTERDQWKVTFNYVDCSSKSPSPQGMASIRYLLSNPDEHIDPQELHREVQDQGFTYKSKYADATVDKTMDKVNLAEAKEMLNNYMRDWQTIEQKTEQDLTIEDLRVLQFLLNIIDTVYYHNPNRTDLMRKRMKLKRTIEKLTVILGLDDNFANPFSYVLQEAQPSGNQKNRIDSLRSGIKRAIKNFEKIDQDLYQYLKVTIITTNNQSSDPNHKPFMFVPSLASNPDYSDIEWDTGGRRSIG